MKRIFYIVILLCIAQISTAQIMLEPIVDSSFGNLSENQISIVVGRLRNIISSNGMKSSNWSRFILAAKVTVLQQEVAGSKVTQHLEVFYTIGDNEINACFGSTSIEVIGIGNTQQQAITSGLKNIKSNNPELKNLFTTAKERIISYYETNGPSIVKKAEGLISSQQWNEALSLLGSIPQECSCYNKAAELMVKSYTAKLNFDSQQILNEAKAIWSAGGNVEEAATNAMNVLATINTSADCYPKALALMDEIHNKCEKIAERNYQDAKKRYEDNLALEKNQQKREYQLEQARIEATKAIGLASANKKTVVKNYYRSWW